MDKAYDLGPLKAVVTRRSVYLICPRMGGGELTERFGRRSIMNSVITVMVKQAMQLKQAGLQVPPTDVFARELLSDLLSNLARRTLAEAGWPPASGPEPAPHS